MGPGTSGDGHRGRPAGGPYQIPVERDGVAVALLAAGDRRGAAAEVVRVHGARVREYLRALLRQRDAADDAYSLFCEWTLSAISGYRGDSSLRTWALGIAYNAARRVRDDAFRRRRRSLHGRELLQLADGARTSSAMRRERAARRLEELKRHLSEDDRNLLALRIDQRLGWEEIASVLASGGQAVTSRALRKRFERLKGRIGRLARELGVIE